MHWAFVVVERVWRAREGFPYCRDGFAPRFKPPLRESDAPLGQHDSPTCAEKPISTKLVTIAFLLVDGQTHQSRVHRPTVFVRPVEMIGLLGPHCGS
jgi:hypothetical protein